MKRRGAGRASADFISRMAEWPLSAWRLIFADDNTASIRDSLSPWPHQAILQYLLLAAESTRWIGGINYL